MRAILLTGFAFVAVAAPAAAQVQRGPWSGAITTDSVVVKAKMPTPNTSAQLLLSTSADLSDPFVLNPGASHATSNIAAFSASGLSPDTTYYYAVREGDTVDTSTAGQFATFPSTPSSFTFAFGSCSETGSSHPVFDHIRLQAPAFFLSPGDFHYQDISTNSPSSFRSAFDSVLGSPRQSNRYRNVPLAYVWDDHDYGGNNANKNSASRSAARSVYQEYVPHYGLAAGSGNVPIDQSFSIGKARFILSDLRSERDVQSATDNSSKRMMSPTQLAWFQQQVLDAQDDGQMIFWVSSVPWIQSKTSGSDMWGGYDTQRQEIANFLDANDVENLVILSGDAHMLAADDGSNANYSDDPTAAAIRVLHVASLDRAGSIKGGPYSEGAFPSESGFGQYALVSVTDLGTGHLAVDYSGRAVDAFGNMTERLSYSFVVAVPEPGSAGMVLALAGILLVRRARPQSKMSSKSCPPPVHRLEKSLHLVEGVPSDQRRYA